MKRIGAGLICAVFLCSLLLAGMAAAGDVTPAGDGQIARYGMEAVVDAHGQAQMTVTVDLELPAPVTELAFPIGKGEDGAVAGQETEKEQTDEGTVLYLSSEAGISGNRSFVITYTVPMAVSKTDAGQQLALDLIAPGWSWPMEEASFSVTMPSEFLASPLYVGGYHGDVVDDYLDLQCDRITFSGSFTEPLRDHDSLAVTLDLPAEYVDLQSAEGISSVVTLILVCLLLAACVAYWYYKLYYVRQNVRLRPMPPVNAGAGDLDTLLSGRPASLPLQVIQWAAMGYLTVFLNGRGRIVLRKNMNMGTERRRQEQAVFALLFEKDAWCDAESLRFRRLAARYAKATTAWWNRRLFSKTSGSPTLLRAMAALSMGIALLGSASAGLPVSRVRWLLLALFAAAGIALAVVLQMGVSAAVYRRYRKALLCALSPAALLLAVRLLGGAIPVLLALVLQVFAAMATLRGGRRSAAGRELLAQSLGFRRYLHHVSQHQLIQQLRHDSQYFYQMLPYAEAVGMGEPFARRFGEVEMEPCDWLETQKRPITNALAFSRQLRTVLQRMETAEK